MKKIKALLLLSIFVFNLSAELLKTEKRFHDIIDVILPTDEIEVYKLAEKEGLQREDLKDLELLKTQNQLFKKVISDLMRKDDYSSFSDKDWDFLIEAFKRYTKLGLGVCSEKGRSWPEETVVNIFDSGLYTYKNIDKYPKKLADLEIKAARFEPIYKKIFEEELSEVLNNCEYVALYGGEYRLFKQRFANIIEPHERISRHYSDDYEFPENAEMMLIKVYAISVVTLTRQKFGRHNIDDIARIQPFRGHPGIEDYLGANIDETLEMINKKMGDLEDFLTQDDETIKKEIRKRLKTWFNNKTSHGTFHIFNTPPKMGHLYQNAQNNPNTQYGEKINSDSNGNRYRINPPKK